jgi:hypothetical protein
LRGAVAIRGAFNLSAAAIVGIYTEAIGVAGAVRCGAASGAVDKGDVVPDLVAVDGILELRMFAGNNR